MKQNFKILFNWWSDNFFLDPLAILIALLGFAIIISKINKRDEVHIFLYYFLAYILLKFITYIPFILGLSYKRGFEIKQFADFIFTLFELFIFFQFFKRTLALRYKSILTLICYLFMLAGLGMLFYDIFATGYPRLTSSYFLFNVQAVSLLIPCTLYYYEIFKLEPTLDLLNEPPFWIITGLSFFMISTLPFSLLMGTLLTTYPKMHNDLFDVFYIFYLILFLMIIRAYLCKPVPDQ